MSKALQYILGIIPNLSGGHVETPFLRRRDGKLSLHFDHIAVQSQMQTAHPYALALGYTRTMMGFLLFNPTPKHIAMIGLGGGSMAKFCLLHLPATQFTAIEINPTIIEFREEFCIPDDDERFRVLCADGAEYVRKQGDHIDVLLVDGFDASSPPPELCSARFYDDCYARLDEGGILVANLWGGDGEHELSLSRIRDSFDRQAVMINAESDSNKIVFAVKGTGFPPERTALLERAIEPDGRHPVKLAATAQKLIGKLYPGRPGKRGATTKKP